jgi:hypothetical protein
MTRWSAPCASSPVMCWKTYDHRARHAKSLPLPGIPRAPDPSDWWRKIGYVFGRHRTVISPRGPVSILTISSGTPRERLEVAALLAEQPSAMLDRHGLSEGVFVLVRRVGHAWQTLTKFVERTARVAFCPQGLLRPVGAAVILPSPAAVDQRA